MAKYHMNKKEREIRDQGELIKILNRGKFATVSMCRDNEPYVVTMNYGYDQKKNALYFHSAQKGLKIDFIRYNPHVCATVVEDRGYLKNECNHAYRSVVFWGKMTTIENLEEKKHGLQVLLHHLEESPDKIKERLLKDDHEYKDLGILRLDIQEMTGKKGQ